MGTLRTAFIGGLLGVACLGLAGTALADEIGNAGDELRTGWYPDESSLTPQLVSSSSFGKLWSAPVSGQVYAQPLLSPTGTQASPSGMLIIATENDEVYGLDPVNGNQQWATDVAPNGPWNPADVSCPDLQPSIGTTSTPVIDTSTNTVYLTHKTYDDSGNAAWYMDALDASTGVEESGWPVPLTGMAQNGPITFFPKTQQQRPGLLLMNGVVYAGFGSHCDVQPWQGWIFGVSTTTHQITTRWVDNTSTNGAGIWQAGAGLTSDGPGQILLATGNGGAPPSPAPGNSPPATCGECVMRLQVQPDGSLKPVDFFAPYDANQLDQSDSDFGSGGVVGLPDQYFGTSSLPHLAVSVGKEGYVYLLNRDNLGGYDQGPGGGDNVVQRIGPRGGVWGRAGVWPGDGGYVYVPTSTGSNGGGLFDVYKYGLTGSGAPSLSLAASSSDVFGWGSGSPIITSDGTSTGSGIVWEIWSADRQGDGGQLRAYSAVPVHGALNELFSASIGHATNYSSPGVGGGRIFVGTRDGDVLAFGSPTPQPLSGSGVSFPPTTDGTSSSQQTLTMTANQAVTVQSLSASPGDFSWSNPSPPLPASLQPGDTLSVQVTFTPSAGETGPVAGQLTASTTDAGDESFSLSGTAQTPNGLLEASPAFLSMGGTQVGNELTDPVTFSNVGGTALTVQDVKSPSAPFSASGLPASGAQIAPNSSITVDVSFQSQSVGRYSGAITLDTTDGQSQTVQLSASASTPGHLQISPSGEIVDFGTVPVGTTATQTFSIANTGGTAVTIEKSKPPFGGEFAASPPTSLPEGTTIQPGQTVNETVTFTPTSPGTATPGVWQINGNDDSGLHQVQFTGTGAAPATPSGTTSSASSTSGAGSSTAPPSASPAIRVLPHAPKLVPAVASTANVTSIYLTYTAAVRGVSRFVLERATVGRRGSHGCVAVTARNRSRARCTRYVAVVSFTHRDRAGANRLRLGAYVPVRKLSAGSYRLESTLLDSAGRKHAFSISLRIIIPAHRRSSVRAASVAAGLERLLLRFLALL